VHVQMRSFFGSTRKSEFFAGSTDERLLSKKNSYFRARCVIPVARGVVSGWRGNEARRRRSEPATLPGAPRGAGAPCARAATAPCLARWSSQAPAMAARDAGTPSQELVIAVRGAGTPSQSLVMPLWRAQSAIARPCEAIPATQRAFARPCEAILATQSAFARPCEAIPATQRAFARPCEAIPATQSAFARPCEAILATQSAFARPCEAIPATRSAFARPCEVIPATQSAFARPCEAIPATRRAFARPCEVIPATRRAVARACEAVPAARSAISRRCDITLLGPERDRTALRRPPGEPELGCQDRGWRSRAPGADRTAWGCHAGAPSVPSPDLVIGRWACRTSPARPGWTPLVAACYEQEQKGQVKRARACAIPLAPRSHARSSIAEERHGRALAQAALE
jgi:hypothetical protein